VVSDPARSGHIIVLSTEGSGYDTVVSVHSSCSPGSVVACDDDGGAGVTSRLQLQVTAGESYLVRVTGYNGANGPYVLTYQPYVGDCGSADFDADGDLGTDADIQAFFACIAGNCRGTCGSADFDGDGDIGTDADIEAFFRVLGGGQS
jgi:hypothetical protein